MIIYRPHRGTLSESMKEVSIYDSCDLMIESIVKDSKYLTGKPLFSAADVSIGPEIFPDYRTGWMDCRYVLISRFADSVYNPPQAIGICATIFPKDDIIREREQSANNALKCE